MTTKAHLKTAKIIAHALDDAVKIGPFKFGLDPIIGLLPVSGDLISLGLGLYLVWIAREADLESEKIVKMISNLVIDFFVGVVPVVGDVADFFFKANTKNLEILEREIGKIVEGEVF